MLQDNFGTLNRQSDWKVNHVPVISARRIMKNKVTLVIIHDRDAFDSIGDGIKKEFYPTLSHQNYLEELSKCDLALLPLQNNVFNRYKSDLMVIERSAARAVPIFSSVVYGNKLQDSELGTMVDDTSNSSLAIVRACNTAFLDAECAFVIAHAQNQRMDHHQAASRLNWFS